MAAPALVSFLGVPGWGALHLELAAPSEPAAMARRLRRAIAAAGPGAAPALLLAAFLRQAKDGRPLGRPWGAQPAGGRRWSHRYRIVWVGSRRTLRVAAWCWHGAGLGWRPCERALGLEGFLARFDPAGTPRLATGRV